jgi:hypothetical protein
MSVDMEWRVSIVDVRIDIESFLLAKDIIRQSTVRNVTEYTPRFRNLNSSDV